ncbi:MAG TPA: 4-(cytidine 5'-diphospho)-2-C-methyl-D-erythritol kinase [Steroidobacteraceae bacterium]|nr:4-(cytidine 5'-diphospho)-2-C-methyl-D-erythritol kinase [Steroidobacteraceae bacterium]
MSELTWWPAPAKLNLFLHVTGRRQDGYHDLQTLFQLIDRCDQIGLAVREDGRIVRTAGLSDVAPEQDLAVRAAQSLQRHTGVPLGADIHVIKHIPAGGGLGGGSSDAASVLLALNTLWHCDLGLAQLAQLGLVLGADVPVFVYGSSAWGEGRGEQLTAMDLPPRWFLVIHPGVGVSTAELFQAPELTRNSPIITIRAFSESGAVNVFEPVVCARRPQVAEALGWLSAQIDAHGVPIEARLTGTGACIFAGFARAADAERVAARVPDRWSSFVARGLNHSPLHAMLRMRG